MSDDLGQLHDVHAFDRAVVDATTDAEAVRSRLTAGELNTNGSSLRPLLEELDQLAQHVDSLRETLAALEARARAELDRWWVASRFSTERLRDSLADLEQLATRSPRAAQRRWLTETAAALVEGWLDAAMTLLRHPVGGDGPFGTSLAPVADDLAAWKIGDRRAGRRAVDGLRSLFAEQLAARKSERAARDLLRCAARLAADDDEAESAVAQIRQQLQRTPQDSVLQAELGSALLRSGALDEAYAAAARAVEMAPSRPDGYLHLGAVEEAQGALDDALDHYSQACRLLNVASLEHLGQGSTLLWPTGQLHYERGRRLEDLEFPRLALQAMRDAARIGLAGSERYPQAKVHEAIVRLQSMLVRPAVEIAPDALLAGKQLLWNGDANRAVIPLRLAVQADVDPTAGWFLAEALLVSSWPDGANRPDRAASEEAERTWLSWLEKTGGPDRSMAWAYATGAMLAERRADWESGRRATWEALLRIEKALVLDNTWALFWGLSARYLRALGFSGLAAEAAAAGADVNPDQPHVQQQQLLTLLHRGQLQEARGYLLDLPGADSDPWLVAVRGWLDLHEHRHADAVQAFSRSLHADTQVSWLYELRAAALVGAGQLDAALSDMSTVADFRADSVAQPGHDDALRRGRASAMVGDLNKAAELLTSVPTSRDAAGPLALTDAVLAAARHDTETARAALQAAGGTLRTTTDAAELLLTWRTAVTLLRHQGALDAEQAETLQQAGAQTLRSSGVEPTAEEDLRRSREQDRDEPLVDVVIRAVEARRHRSAGDLDLAVAAYSSLTDTAFEPECRIGLTETLLDMLHGAARDGDLRRALSAHRRLAERGDSPYASEQLVIADTVGEEGDRREAMAVLQQISTSGTDDRTRLQTHQRLGKLAADLGDESVATGSLEAAVQQADELHDLVASAQAHARLALLAANRHDKEGTVQHILAAFQRLSQAGSLDPLFTLAVELRGLVGKAASSTVAQHLAEAYTEATRSIGNESELYGHAGQR